jgi:hypothetical protein
MASSPPPLWPGYDEASDDDLLALLDSKVDAMKDEKDPTDERAVKDFAQAIASHEWLKQNKNEYRERLHARADKVRVGSWRP